MLKPQEFPDTQPSLLSSLAKDGVGQSAWREFFERYAPAVYRVACFRGLSDADADDIVQQVMLSVSKHIGTFRYDRNRGQFRQWVRRITENAILQLRRKRQRATVDVSWLDGCIDDQPDAEQIWQREWDIQDLLWCLEQVANDVAPRTIRAFRMYALDGQPAAEVAEQLGMTVGHVYVTRHLILNRIRQRMNQLEEGNRQ